MKKTLLVIALAAGLSSMAQAQVVSWNFTGDTGDQPFEAASFSAPDITGGDITRGGGLVSSAAINSFSSSGWDALSAGDEYLSFGFTVADGYTLDLGSLVVGTRASGTGPGTLGLFYSGDSFNTQLYTFTQNNTAFLNSNINLSALPELTGNVEFRIYEIGNTQADGSGTTASTGTFRLVNHNLGGSMAFTGSVTAVPEPETYAMLLAGLAVLGAAARRRQAA